MVRHHRQDDRAAQLEFVDLIRKVLLVAHWDWVLHNFRMPVARALREEGLDVSFVCPPGQYVANFEREGFRCLHWAVDRRGMRPLREKQSIAELTRIYRAEQSDVVHHFTVKPNLYGSIAARRADVPVVINTFTGLGFLFSRRWPVVTLRALLGPWMRRALAGKNVWTIVQNEADRSELVKSRLVAATRTRLIPGSGVDVSRFYPSFDRPRATPRVITAARLLQDKGIADIVAIARLLRDGGVPAEFVVAGEPDPGNPRSISDRQLDEWRREGVVTFLGHRDDMDEVLRDADVALFPSYYPEGLSRFLLEAAASGLPLVATDIPGCQPVVRPGENGFLVTPKDVEGMATALQQLLRDPGLRRRFGISSRRLAEELFSEGSIVGQYLALYREVAISTSV